MIGRTIFFTSDKNRPTRDEIYFIDFWRENLSLYRINKVLLLLNEHGDPLFLFQNLSSYNINSQLHVVATHG